MHLHACCWFLLPQIDLFNLIKEFNSSFHRLSSMSVFQLCMFKLVQHQTYMNYAVQVPSNNVSQRERKRRRRRKAEN